MKIEDVEFGVDYDEDAAAPIIARVFDGRWVSDEEEDFDTLRGEFLGFIEDSENLSVFYGADGYGGADQYLQGLRIDRRNEGGVEVARAVVRVLVHPCVEEEETLAHLVHRAIAAGKTDDDDIFEFINDFLRREWVPRLTEFYGRYLKTDAELVEALLATGVEKVETAVEVLAELPDFSDVRDYVYWIVVEATPDEDEDEDED